MSEDEPTYSVDVKIQRGNGTDDRDTLKSTVQANTLDELDERIDEMRGRLEELAVEVRAIQPDDTTAQRIAEGQRTLDDQESES